tara:strand:+ start:822 stop:929 length:108 start_codon:yes stop_codon:yes gene_type:complete
MGEEYGELTPLRRELRRAFTGLVAPRPVVSGVGGE